VGAALLAPLAVLLQIAPPLFVTPWFMRIDLVAVPWIICWMVFDLKSSLLSLLISLPLVGVLGPFAGGIVGIVMKSVASIWMFLIPAFFAQRVGGIQKLLDNKPLFVVAALCALAVRAVVTVFFNFYFALPIFFGMTPEAIFLFFTALQSFVGQSLGLIGLGAYIAEIAFWNTLQGAIELFISLIVGTTITRRLLIKQEVREAKTEAHSD
jgi:riboflavin transporter FmnP